MLMFRFYVSDFIIMEITSFASTRDVVNSYLDHHFPVTVINEIVIADEVFVVYCNSKLRLDELVELYRLTGHDMQYSQMCDVLKLRYNTLIELIKLINQI